MRIGVYGAHTWELLCPSVCLCVCFFFWGWSQWVLTFALMCTEIENTVQTDNTWLSPQNRERVHSTGLHTSTQMYSTCTLIHAVFTYRKHSAYIGVKHTGCSVHNTGRRIKWSNIENSGIIYSPHSQWKVRWSLLVHETNWSLTAKHCCSILINNRRRWGLDRHMIVWYFKNIKKKQLKKIKQNKNIQNGSIQLIGMIQVSGSLMIP